ncbi:hypothetical protein GCM10009555_086600 [Acrocarpospora macrocephala]|uniref:Uncharacterized protein n=1 Tax=Acrocarpospora macrocephala TaxID=150177 RepID=A0A5M3WJU5_9ACTN|nr:hypothetical protein [Acrocarpospora macrocephala]GES08906.1 hypothetical protein Amac_025020 [Acrocarpospora macrocephala]
MDPDTFRGDVGVEGGDVYWRRRVSVLTGMLVVVAVVAWGCASGSDKPTTTPKAGSGGTDAMVVSLPSPKVSPPAASPQPSGSPTHGPHGSPSPSLPPRKNGEPCVANDLVVSLRASQEIYKGDQIPGFLLTVVNIGQIACTADLGPRALEMRISTGGQRIWSTADCVAGEGVDRQLLHRGVPFVRSIQWPRYLSGNDCAADPPTARKGKYVALARFGTLKSSRNVFQLK